MSWTSRAYTVSLRADLEKFLQKNRFIRIALYIWLEENFHPLFLKTSSWNSVIYGAIKEVPHACLFGYV